MLVSVSSIDPFPRGGAAAAGAAVVAATFAFFAVCRRQPPAIAELMKAPASRGHRLSRLRFRSTGISFVLGGERGVNGGCPVSAIAPSLAGTVGPGDYRSVSSPRNPSFRAQRRCLYSRGRIVATGREM